jgi:hypothetical protein
VGFQACSIVEMAGELFKWFEKDSPSSVVAQMSKRVLGALLISLGCRRWLDETSLLCVNEWMVRSANVRVWDKTFLQEKNPLARRSY